jgi:hypothetical protein
VTFRLVELERLRFVAVVPDDPHARSEVTDGWPEDINETLSVAPPEKGEEPREEPGRGPPKSDKTGIIAS